MAELTRNSTVAKNTPYETGMDPAPTSSTNEGQFNDVRPLVLTIQMGLGNTVKVFGSNDDNPTLSGAPNNGSWGLIKTVNSNDGGFVVVPACRWILWGETGNDGEVVCN